MANRILATCFVLACLCRLGVAGETTPKNPPARKAFFHAREHQTDYRGPGREQPEPVDTSEVLIGYFGPGDPSNPQGGDMWLAAQLAVEGANRQGGFRGKPFRLVPGWSDDPWGTGVRQVVRMVYREKVWAIVGGIDGPSTHLAEQVVAKARLTLVSPASTDKTVNLANVPWMFSLAPGDHLQAPLLATAIWQRMGGKGDRSNLCEAPFGPSRQIGPVPFSGHKPFVLVSANDHDSHLFTVELGKYLAARRMVPRYQFQCRHTARDITELAAKITQSKPSGVVLIAAADQSARLVVALREGGFTGPVFGGPSMGRRRFQQQAGTAAEGVLFPLLYDLQEAAEEFPRTFQSRFERFPDYAAAHSYDAVQLLVAAIRKAGLNRARIRDAVAGLSPWSGVAGTVQWDPLGSNTRPVQLGTIRDGRVVPVTEQRPN